MNAAETIQAAIDKLTEAKAIGWPCAEWQQSAVRHIARNCEISCDCANCDEHPGWNRYKSGPAITMLVRTIDAQLAILEWGAQVHDLKHDQHPSPLERRALGLARAILGGDS